MAGLLQVAMSDLLIILAIAAAAAVILAYFLLLRRSKNEAHTPVEPQRQPQPIQYPQGIREVGSRSGVLLESKPVEVKPLQRGIDIERIEKIIKGIQTALEQLIRQSSAETADVIIAKLMELKAELEKISIQCSMQYPPFTQVGYVPQSILEFKELLSARYVAVYLGGSVIESQGDSANVDEDIVRSMRGDLAVSLVGDDLIYMIRYGNYRLLAVTKHYLDSISMNLLRELFRRYIDEVRIPGSS